MTPQSKADAKRIREVIHAALPSPRIDWPSPTKCVVYGLSDVESSHYAASLAETGRVEAGVEGHEYLRALGQVQHVYALRMGPVQVRVVSSPIYPRGLFSNLKSLERTIRA